jgi:TM2 domain-containing membrane protein YozV
MKISINKNIVLIFLCIIVCYSNSYAQKRDSISVGPMVQEIAPTKVDTIKKENFYAKWKKSKVSDPKTAVILSAILPGAGQLYNKKHAWFGLITSYAALGTTLYISINNTRNYRILRDEYKARVETGKWKYASLKNKNDNSIKLQRDAFQKAKEQSYFAVGGAYLYCIGEAFVTAHLRSFDVSDDISMKIKPASTGFGIGFLATF